MGHHIVRDVHQCISPATTHESHLRTSSTFGSKALGTTEVALQQRKPVEELSRVSTHVMCKAVLPNCGMTMITTRCDLENL